MKKFSEKIGNYNIKCLVGSPGCGKTSVAQWLVIQNSKQGIPVWSNVPLTGSYVLDFNDLMKFDICEINGQGERVHGGVFIIDEAGIEFNSRNWDKMSKNFIAFFKLHRHFKLDIYIFSQGNDIDITLRRLAQQWFKIVKPWWGFGKYSQLIPVSTQLVIENGDWKIIYEPDKFIFSSRLVPIYKTWGYFDSFDIPNLPIKAFEKWGELNIDKQKEKKSFKIKIKFLKIKIKRKLNKKLWKEDTNWKEKEGE